MWTSLSPWLYLPFPPPPSRWVKQTRSAVTYLHKLKLNKVNIQYVYCLEQKEMTVVNRCFCILLITFFLWAKKKPVLSRMELTTRSLNVNFVNKNFLFLILFSLFCFCFLRFYVFFNFRLQGVFDQKIQITTSSTDKYLLAPINTERTE